jgi:hypothetical protein
LCCRLHCARNCRYRSYLLLDLPRHFPGSLLAFCLTGFRLLPQSKGNVGHMCNRSHTSRAISTEPWIMGNDSICMGPWPTNLAHWLDVSKFPDCASLRRLTRSLAGDTFYTIFPMSRWCLSLNLTEVLIVMQSSSPSYAQNLSRQKLVLKCSGSHVLTLRHAVHLELQTGAR